MEITPTITPPADRRSSPASSEKSYVILDPSRHPGRTAEMEQFLTALEQRLDLDTLDIGTAEKMAAAVTRMVAAIPRRDATTLLDELVGPFYRAVDYGTWQSITRQAVSSRIHNRTVLAIKSADGVLSLPTFQFSDTGAPLPGLAPVLKAFDPTGKDPVGCALWLTGAADAFGGRTPAEMLRAGELAPVLEIAHRIRAALAA